ncbi:MAG: hypothetical protein MJ249_15480, partial [Kiritimatiellae bacterium]|nr:hypothetical protein [Kiritimatiellia bacterium]
MIARKVKQMLIVALVACAGIQVSNAAAVASDEKEFALLPPVILTGLSATTITSGQTLADSTITGTATAFDFGEVAGTFTWDSPTTEPTLSEREATAFAITFTPADPNHGRTATTTLKLPPVVASGEGEFALLPPVILTDLSATPIANGQTLAASTISGTATVLDFGEVAGTFTWDSPTTVPSISDSQTTAYALTFTPADPNHCKTGPATLKLPPIAVCGEMEFALLPPVTLLNLSATAI